MTNIGLTVPFKGRQSHIVNKLQAGAERHRDKMAKE